MTKLALVGCGDAGRQHAEHLALVGKLVAVCDVVPERAAAVVQHQQATVYTDFDKMLAAEKDLDLLVVCTPTGLHAEHCIKGLQAGCNVLAESPLCLTTAAAWQLIETEKFSRRRLFVVQRQRYNPLLQQLRHIIAENKLGPVYSFRLNCLVGHNDDRLQDWHGSLFPGGGLLYNLFAPYIDALHLLFGTVASVAGFANNVAHNNGFDCEDQGTASLRMQTGVIGSMEWSINAASGGEEVELLVVAEKATVRLSGEFMDGFNVIHAERPGLLDGFEPARLNHLEAAYKHLHTELPGNGQNLPGVFEGLGVVELIEKIYKAAR